MDEERGERKVGTAYLFWLLGLFGICGIHRFYAGRYISGIIWLLTGGLFFIGQLIDMVMLPRMIEDYNEGAEVW